MKAFTLIELLVVVTIIALLISLLTVGMADTRKITQGTQCQANLHNLGIAIRGFVLDENRLPYGSYIISIPGSTHEVMEQLDEYIDGPNPKQGDDAFLLLKPWVCPTDQVYSVGMGCSYGYVPGIDYDPEQNGSCDMSKTNFILIRFEQWPMSHLMEDIQWIHHNHTKNVVRNDGSVFSFK